MRPLKWWRLPVYWTLSYRWSPPSIRVHREPRAAVWTLTTRQWWELYCLLMLLKCHLVRLLHIGDPLVWVHPLHVEDRIHYILHFWYSLRALIDIDCILTTAMWGWLCVCYWAVLMPSCSLTRTESPSGPTWSRRTPTPHPAAPPALPCARRSPPPARCRQTGRTCAPAAVRRSWTDTCWRWEADLKSLDLNRLTRCVVTTINIFSSCLFV